MITSQHRMQPFLRDTARSNPRERRKSGNCIERGKVGLLEVYMNSPPTFQLPTYLSRSFAFGGSHQTFSTSRARKSNIKSSAKSSLSLVENFESVSNRSEPPERSRQNRSKRRSPTVFDCQGLHGCLVQFARVGLFYWQPSPNFSVHKFLNVSAREVCIDLLEGVPDYLEI